MPSVTIAEIEQAQERLTGLVCKTPLIHSPSLSEVSGNPVYLKLEHHQITGSFKLRGATNAVLNLSEEQRLAGVVGVSTGNHGRGLARACKEAGVNCTICMSELVPQNKIDGIRAEGAEVLISGRSQDEADIEAEKLVASGKTLIPPFDNPNVIAGQGTLGLECFGQIPDLETAVIPLSGGGLLSGVGAALRARNPKIKIIAVTMERGAAMYECVRAGKYVAVEEIPTLADSLGGGIGPNNQYTFEMVRDLVDDYLLVTEAEIAEAIRYAFWQEGQIMEGSGSVGLAAVLSGKVKASGKTVLICSGGNIDRKMHRRITAGENVDMLEETK